MLSRRYFVTLAQWQKNTEASVRLFLFPEQQSGSVMTLKTLMAALVVALAYVALERLWWLLAAVAAVVLVLLLCSPWLLLQAAESESSDIHSLEAQVGLVLERCLAPLWWWLLLPMPLGLLLYASLYLLAPHHPNAKRLLALQSHLVGWIGLWLCALRGHFDQALGAYEQHRGQTMAKVLTAVALAASAPATDPASAALRLIRRANFLGFGLFALIAVAGWITQ